MKRLFLTLLFVMLLPPAVSASADTTVISLEEALERAMTANRDIQTAKQRLAELEGLKGEARAQGLPQLTGTGSYQRMHRKPKLFINGQPFTVGSDNTYTASAELDQLLWDGGKVINAIKAAKTELYKGLQDVRSVQEEVRLNVKQTFYQILYTEKVIEVLNRQLKTLKGHLSAIKTRFNKGLESDYTVMRQEVEVSNIEPQLIEAQRVRELLLNGLKILMAVPPEENITLKGDFSYTIHALPNKEGLVEKALSNRPDLLAQKFREKSLVANVGVEKAGYWPTLNFKTSLLWQGQSNNWSLSPNERADSLTSTVNLSWPIFDGLKTSSRVKQAKAKLIQQRFQTSQLADSVVREVQDALTTLEKAQTTLKTQLGTLNTAKRATAIASTRFEAGLTNQLELLDTITAQAESEQLYYGAIFNCLSAEAALEKAIGGPP
jgi:HAE1 family hydrophobic/amphiphilic exporter-1